MHLETHGRSSTYEAQGVIKRSVPGLKNRRNVCGAKLHQCPFNSFSVLKCKMKGQKVIGRKKKAIKNNKVDIVRDQELMQVFLEEWNYRAIFYPFKKLTKKPAKNITILLMLDVAIN